MDGNELLLSDVMGTDSDIVYRCIEEQVDKSLLDDAMQRLSTREKRIVELRFGLGDGKRRRKKKLQTYWAYPSLIYPGWKRELSGNSGAKSEKWSRI